MKSLSLLADRSVVIPTSTNYLLTFKEHMEMVPAEGVCCTDFGNVI